MHAARARAVAEGLVADGLAEWHGEELRLPVRTRTRCVGLPRLVRPDSATCEGAVFAVAAAGHVFAMATDQAAAGSTCRRRPDRPHAQDYVAALKRTMKEVKDDDVPGWRRGVAFKIFLSLFPALLAAVGDLQPGDDGRRARRVVGASRRLPA